VGRGNNVSVQHELEPSQNQAGRPLTVTVGATQPPPTPREDPVHPRKGGGHVATSPGRPAGPTWQPLLLSLGMKDKLNELTCVQLTLSPVPTSE